MPIFTAPSQAQPHYTSFTAEALAHKLASAARKNALNKVNADALLMCICWVLLVMAKISPVLYKAASKIMFLHPFRRTAHLG